MATLFPVHRDWYLETEVLLASLYMECCYSQLTSANKARKNRYTHTHVHKFIKMYLVFAFIYISVCLSCFPNCQYKIPSTSHLKEMRFISADSFKRFRQCFDVKCRSGMVEGPALEDSCSSHEARKQRVKGSAGEGDASFQVKASQLTLPWFIHSLSKNPNSEYRRSFLSQMIMLNLMTTMNVSCLIQVKSTFRLFFPSQLCISKSLL